MCAKQIFFFVPRIWEMDFLINPNMVVVGTPESLALRVPNAWQWIILIGVLFFVFFSSW